ncbi:MAG: TetR family transcriptional regulator [Mycobacterium sp.]
MALQARAEATRRKIIETAVELFGQIGYGETGLAGVLQRAGVSKGAFYYHFDSKEAVATAIIDEFNNRTVTAVEENFDAAAPTLDGIIASTFAVQGLMHRDPATQIGQQLAQALNQVSSAGSRVYTGWTAAFVEMAGGVARAGGLRPDVDPVDVGEAIWAGILGSHLVSAACGDDPYVRLARSWRMLVSSIAPHDEVSRLHELLDDIVDRYQAAV